MEHCDYNNEYFTPTKRELEESQKVIAKKIREIDEKNDDREEEYI